MLLDLVFDAVFIAIILVISPLVFVMNVVEWYRIAPHDEEERSRCMKAVRLSSVGVLFWAVIFLNCFHQR